EKVVKAFGGEVCLTSDKHNSGTERLAEVVTKLALPDDEIVVNIQGDEPLIPPVIVKQVAEKLDKYQVNMATLSVKIDEAEELNKLNMMKLVTYKNVYVRYFYRAVIPWNREKLSDVYQQTQEIEHFELLVDLYQRHIGIYAYKAGFIRKYVAWQ